MSIKYKITIVQIWLRRIHLNVTNVLSSSDKFIYAKMILRWSTSIRKVQKLMLTIISQFGKNFKKWPLFFYCLFFIFMAEVIWDYNFHVKSLTMEQRDAKALKSKLDKFKGSVHSTGR